jgi:hypothetical protein
MEVVAIFRLGRILQMAGLSSLQRWERLLPFPKWAAFIITMSAALPDSLCVGDFSPGVHVRCADAWSNGQIVNGILDNLFQKASDS